MLFPQLGSLLYVTFWRPSMAGLGRRVLCRTFLRHELLDQQKTIYVLFTKLATWTVAIIGQASCIMSYLLQALAQCVRAQRKTTVANNNLIFI